MKIQTEISDDIIRNLLCCAFEGGSNYWYLIDRKVLPPVTTIADYREGGSRQPKDNYWHWSQLIPLDEGGALVITAKEADEIDGKKEWTLNREAIRRGCEIMAQKYPQHWGDAIGGSEDATTGDVFLQCCLFGTLVFG
jgi:hypothetical protein